MKVAKKRYKKTIQQEKRLQKIIEICFINKDLNKEWIKQLQLFITNLDKMIKDQNQKIKRCEDEHEEMKNLERDTIKAYKEKLVKITKNSIFDNFSSKTIERLSVLIRTRAGPRTSMMAYSSRLIRSSLPLTSSSRWTTSFLTKSSKRKRERWRLSTTSLGRCLQRGMLIRLRMSIKHLGF